MRDKTNDTLTSSTPIAKPSNIENGHAIKQKNKAPAPPTPLSTKEKKTSAPQPSEKLLKESCQNDLKSIEQCNTESKNINGNADQPVNTASVISKENVDTLPSTIVTNSKSNIKAHSDDLIRASLEEQASAEDSSLHNLSLFDGEVTISANYSTILEPVHKSSSMNNLLDISHVSIVTVDSTNESQQKNRQSASTIAIENPCSKAVNLRVEQDEPNQSLGAGVETVPKRTSLLIEEKPISSPANKKERRLLAEGVETFEKCLDSQTSSTRLRSESGSSSTSTSRNTFLPIISASTLVSEEIVLHRTAEPKSPQSGGRPLEEDHETFFQSNTKIKNNYSENETIAVSNTRNLFDGKDHGNSLAGDELSNSGCSSASNTPTTTLRPGFDVSASLSNSSATMSTNHSSPSETMHADRLTKSDQSALIRIQHLNRNPSNAESYSSVESGPHHAHLPVSTFGHLSPEQSLSYGQTTILEDPLTGVRMRKNKQPEKVSLIFL